MKIRWSEIAEADLYDIYDYIARDVPYYAEQFIDKLLKSTDKLERHPKIGRRVPEADGRDDVRELIVHGYRIIYAIQDDELNILTVIHDSRDLSVREDAPWHNP